MKFIPRAFLSLILCSIVIAGTSLAASPKSNRYQVAQMKQKALLDKMKNLVNACKAEGGTDCEGKARSNLLFQRQRESCVENGSTPAECQARLKKFKPKRK